MFSSSVLLVPLACALQLDRRREKAEIGAAIWAVSALISADSAATGAISSSSPQGEGAPGVTAAVSRPKLASTRSAGRGNLARPGLTRRGIRTRRKGILPRYFQPFFARSCARSLPVCSS
jgi:hypothetical protein